MTNGFNSPIQKIADLLADLDPLIRFDSVGKKYGRFQIDISENDAIAIQQVLEKVSGGRDIWWCEQHDDQQYDDKTHYCGVNWDGGASAECLMVPYRLSPK